MKRTASLLIAATLAVTLLAACGSNKKSATPATTTTSSTTSTTSPIGPLPKLKVTPVATLSEPTAMAQADDSDTIFATERAGKVRAIRNGVVDPVPVVDISDEVSTDGERGLLGIAFAPNSSRFYLYYTDKSGDIHVSEFTMSDNETVDLHTKRDLLTIPHSQQSNHNGGQLAFGPDNLLYIGVGDGGGAGDPDKNGQNLTVLLGKILRINPAASTNLPYTIPYDNPFVKQPGARGEIWAYGLRNPWRFSFDSTEKGIWIGDVGQNNWEEIDHVASDAKGGQNYGWSLREGTHQQDGDKPANATDPVYEYPHTNQRCSVTGGYVYRGKNIPDLTGRYMFADYCSGQLMALTQKGTSWSESDVDLNVKAINSFGQDHQGEIYVISLDGPIGRIDAA